MSVDPTTAGWIDGGKLVHWLEHDRRTIDTEHTEDFGDRFGRMIRGWKTEGRRTRVHAVDEFLCAIGVCLGEIPEDFYCTDPRAGKAPHSAVTPEQSEQIVNLRRLGWTHREIAAMAGVTPRTVSRHLRGAGLA